MSKPIRSAAAADNRVMKIAGLVIVLAAGLALSACNTTNGAGQDIKAGGQDLSNAAASVQKKL